MPSYITRDFHCSACHYTFTVMVDRAIDAETDRVECELCDEWAWRQMSAPMVLSHSHPDGSGRFNKLRESAKLRKDRAAARAAGDVTSEKKINSEIKRHGK